MPHRKEHRRRRRSRRGGFGLPGKHMFRGSMISDLCRNSSYKPLADACKDKHKLKKLENILNSCESNLSGEHKIDIQPITAAIESAKQATVAAGNSAQVKINEAKLAKKAAENDAKLAKMAEQMKKAREKKANDRGVQVGGSRRRRRTKRRRRRKTRRRSTRGTRSKTHKGRKNYTTKRGDKVFHRRRHYVRRKRRPYRR